MIINLDWTGQLEPDGWTTDRSTYTCGAHLKINNFGFVSIVSCTNFQYNQILKLAYSPLIQCIQHNAYNTMHIYSALDAQNFAHPNNKNIVKTFDISGVCREIWQIYNISLKKRSLYTLVYLFKLVNWGHSENNFGCKFGAGQISS